MTRRAIVAAAAVTIVLTGAVAASASIPNPDGTFSGCVSNSTGDLRVIDPSKPGNLGHCVTSGPHAETPITWSQRGPQGPAGHVAIYNWDTYADNVSVTPGGPVVLAQMTDAFPHDVPYVNGTLELGVVFSPILDSPTYSCELDYEATDHSWSLWGTHIYAGQGGSVNVPLQSDALDFPPGATGRLRLTCTLDDRITAVAYTIQIGGQPTEIVALS